LAVLFSWSLANLLSITVDTNTHQLIDQNGRSRIFHGVNVVQKSEPYYPTSLLTPERMDLLRDWGFNAVRLGVMWIGTEPNKGYFNQTYLDQIESIVEQLAQRGIYALLDSHQDLYSPKWCGDGAPLWAAIPAANSKPFAEPLYGVYSFDNSTGLPESCPEPWASYYMTEACCSSFQSLYDNTENLSDHYAAFWTTIAERFSNVSSVLGYELINEPFPGNVYANPALLIPGVGDRENLQPFYEKLNTAIRKTDENHIIFYEPITWDVTPVGFTQVPGGDTYQNRSVLSWHYYCWTFDGNNMNPIRWGLCKVEQVDMFYLRSRDVDRLGGAGFLTEFGLCDGNSTSDEFECTQVMDKADQYLQSWTYWDYSDGEFYYSDGSPKQYLVEEFTRTYARAVAGEILSMNYDTRSKKFTLEFSSLSLPENPPTEIFFAQSLHYAKGFNVEISPSNSATWSVDSPNILSVYLVTPINGTIITITLTADVRLDLIDQQK